MVKRGVRESGATNPVAPCSRCGRQRPDPEYPLCNRCDRTLAKSLGFSGARTLKP